MQKMAKFNMDSDIREYFPGITKKQIDQFRILLKVFPEWNAKLNLISRNDIEHLFERHILHSLAIAKVFSFAKNTKIIDIGTGGGFPGIPLAILFPEVKFDLVDSIGKKIVAVKAISEELKLTNVNAIQTRAENLPPVYDFIVSRAVTAFPKFVEFSNGLIRKKNDKIRRGIIYLKGGDFAEELKPFAKAEVFKITDFFDSEFFETKKIIFLPLKK
jgi:16S rRNA (guanine527-N7)-methyltransferase